MSNEQIKEIPLDKITANFLIKCIDCYQKTHGLSVSGNCFAVAKHLDSFFAEKENPVEDEKEEAA